MSPENDMTISLIGLAICVFIGVAGFREHFKKHTTCLLYTSPSPRDGLLSRMPSSA